MAVGTQICNKGNYVPRESAFKTYKEGKMWSLIHYNKNAINECVENVLKIKTTLPRPSHKCTWIKIQLHLHRNYLSIIKKNTN